MKQFLPVVWWLTATLVIAFVLVGLGYLFADALLLGVLFLPGMLTARYFVPQLSFETDGRESSTPSTLRWRSSASNTSR